jgi:thymidylate synthase (FAD)
VVDYNEAVHMLGLLGHSRKQAREAARAFLPNCAETRMVFTGNHEAWRNIVQQRGTIHADAEIREFAVAVLVLLKSLEPNLYQDLAVVRDASGVDIVDRVR